ncbi:hypothetical protein SEA_CRICKO_38 [Streptomyces phage CricKo]|jgi:hypothetical protein|nr:hypothetical protein SEA_RAINYDAI_37 [Streptomyces phage Rainydai]AWN06139.1 hypothetical protein SEA_SENDITCS_36 [Streptomyces phage SendItCS]QJD49921.1 hypothetical protein SEA_CRICKO_38 [Streptomyces phage CricKo]QNL30653.1 hypothetical protein SEA_THIQQUMS_38 [Streptomyces phage Thiqqums]WIC89374.1 hypothetical protein SEA_MIEK_37 [Streptomyces phage Miek]
MQIKVIRPHPDYPLVHVHIPLTVDTEREDLADILAASRMTLLGRWEPNIAQGKVEGMKAPALLEDEHVKPKKTRKR